MDSMGLIEEYQVYIRSKCGETIFKIDEADMMYSSLMQTMFLDKEVVSDSDNPFVFSEISDENLTMIVRYIKRCAKNKKELPAPAKPLSRNTLPDILGDDYVVFKPIMETKMSDSEKFKALVKLMMDITYLDMPILREKACAAIASVLIGKSMEAIRMMVTKESVV